MTDRTSVVYTKNETGVVLPIRPWFVMKTIQDNDMVNSIGAVCAKNHIELSWLIGPSVVCDKN